MVIRGTLCASARLNRSVRREGAPSLPVVPKDITLLSFSSSFTLLPPEKSARI